MVSIKKKTSPALIITEVKSKPGKITLVSLDTPVIQFIDENATLEVLEELKTGSAWGTRRAVKVKLTSGSKKFTGWITREFLNWHAVRGAIKPESIISSVPVDPEVTSGPGYHPTKEIRSEDK